MSTDRRPQLSELFHAALARDPSTRAAFLSEACRGDPALQSELERLLAAHGDAGSFLEAPVGTPAGVRRLNPGASVGAYCITHFIGAGGMGEVYRARDARLGRDVAIKILPASAAADAERRTRFAREAHAIAALNHPNIVTIHSVEQSEDLHFLTMELVEGKTLRELITPGGLPVDRLLQIAIPLADAIGTAHAHGIIHRDLKPANVMVTPEGRVKVLDFGLAKLKAPEPAATSVTTMPAREITDDGRVLGTVAYMSPEQAEGRDVDQRTDIFSLGVLLFELATGRQPFTGDSNVSLLSSILKDVPPSVTELRPELPQDLGRLIRRCLAKEPGRRYQSALDLRNDLEELRHDQESGVIAATPKVAAGATQSRPLRTVWLAGALMALAIFAGVAYLTWPRPSDQTPPQPTRTTLPPPIGVRVAQQSSALILAISPDGRWVAFEGVSDDANRRGLYLRSIGELESRLVVRDVDGSSPFFSPDSKWLGFWANNAIWKVPVADGKGEQRICDVPDQLRGASWGDDGAIVFTATMAGQVGQLWRVPAAGGTSTPITSRAAGDISYFFPHVLPGSKAALVMLLEGRASPRTIAIVSLQTGAIIRRLYVGATPQYTQDGFLIFRRGEILYSAPFDVEALEVIPAELPVLTGVSYNTGGSETSAFGVSRTGALVFMPPVRRAEDAELVWLDRTDRTQPAVDARGDYGWPALDPEERRVAVHVRNSVGRDLWVYDFTAKTWEQLTHGFRTTGSIVWSSNGQWIVSSSEWWGNPSLFRVSTKSAEGGGPERLTSRGSVTGTFVSAYDFATSTHDNVVMFHRQVASNRMDLLTLLLEPRGEPTPFLESGHRTMNGQISPDGRWVAYDSTEAGGRQVFVRSLAEPSRRWQVASDAFRPSWARDGRSLRYAKNDEIWAVPVSSDSAGREIRFGPPDLVIKHDLLAQRDIPGFTSSFNMTEVTPSPHGRRFLVVKRPATERQLFYVPNWVAEVKDAMRRSSASAR